MTTAALKNILNQYTDHTEYTIVFIEKGILALKSYYIPETKQIVVHDKEFKSDNEMIYAAFHELAHHIDYAEHRELSKRNAHGGRFYFILHDLINRAINAGDFIPIEEFYLENVRAINNQSVEQLREMGQALVQMVETCRSIHYPIEDVITRVLHMKEGEVDTLIRIFQQQIPDKVGGEFARRLGRIKNPQKLQECIETMQMPLPKPKKKGGEPENTEESSIDDFISCF